LEAQPGRLASSPRQAKKIFIFSVGRGNRSPFRAFGPRRRYEPTTITRKQPKQPQSPEHRDPYEICFDRRVHRGVCGRIRLRICAGGERAPRSARCCTGTDGVARPGGTCGRLIHRRPQRRRPRARSRRRRPDDPSVERLDLTPRHGRDRSSPQKPDASAPLSAERWIEPMNYRERRRSDLAGADSGGRAGGSPTLSARLKRGGSPLTAASPPRTRSQTLSTEQLDPPINTPFLHLLDLD
jgi:hypothetical protein